MASVSTDKNPELVYDVGMHKGEDSDYYLKKGFTVVGFEADPDLAEHCRQRFAEELRSGRLTIVEGAIVRQGMPGIENGRIKFFKNRGTTIWGTVVSDWAERNEILGSTSETIEVPVVDFTRCLAEHGIPHFLKIDIEGMDSVCLEALHEFDHKPDFVSIESEKVSFARLVAELNLLVDLGYTGFKAVQQMGIGRQREPDPAREGRRVGYRFKEGASGLFGGDLPGEWVSYEDILDRYRRIFLEYDWLGDTGRFSRYLVGKAFRELLCLVLRRPVPGWYDTHARHASATPPEAA
jgi:FkbM family methyltransferase